MSRRRTKKTSPAEDFISLIALMPWWAGVLAAVVLYLVLHQMAQQTVVIGRQPDIGQVMTQSLGKSLATLGQYLLPLLCLVGAAASAWKRHTRKTLAANVTANPAADALDGMSWQQFEVLVGEAFRQQGFSVFENGGGGADGGVDLVLRKGTEKFLVQCKQWKAYKVGVDVVRELYGVMAAQGAAGGFVVTSGRFTEEAKLFASGRNVRLVDGLKLRELMG